ncbi:MAG TPA: hypothetical protein VKB59_13895 [Micromonosporaceae bacterium]|nr:hypothetical protein [Micromonosporaceae bacterium]
MAAPQFVRYLVAALGVLLVLVAARSVIGTVVVPRPVSSWLTRGIDRLVNITFQLATRRTANYRRRDRVLSAQAATVLLSQIVIWLLLFYVGYSLILWPFVDGGITTAFSNAGPALWAIGEAHEHGAAERAILDIAALTSLVTVTLQIAYLPTLYSAFNSRETEVALLNARAGLPAWGPELLVRTHFGLGSGTSTLDRLPQLYADWERLAADITESHTTYPVLVRFRSPKPLSSWVTALLAVVDSAAMLLALSPGRAPTVTARLCLRSGFLCFNEIAAAMGLRVPGEFERGGISVTYEEFLDAIAELRAVDFPIERDPKDAWPDFVGWRVNYEKAAYGIAEAVDAPPALWSGPRRFPGAAIPPIRPPL